MNKKTPAWVTETEARAGGILIEAAVRNLLAEGRTFQEISQRLGVNRTSLERYLAFQLGLKVVYTASLQPIIPAG